MGSSQQRWQFESPRTPCLDWRCQVLLARKYKQPMRPISCRLACDKNTRRRCWHFGSGNPVGTVHIGSTAVSMSAELSRYPARFSLYPHWYRNTWIPASWWTQDCPQRTPFEVNQLDTESVAITTDCYLTKSWWLAQSSRSASQMNTLLFTCSQHTDKQLHPLQNVGWNYLSISKFQRCSGGSLGMDKLFHPAL